MSAAELPRIVAAVNKKLLGIYLNDHLAAATGALELIGRSLSSNRGTDLASFLEHLRGEIDDDREALKDLMGGLNVGVDPLKQAVAWLTEKVGRLKLNGSLLGYSPLSRLVELEALTTGVAGKLSLWQAVSEVPDHPALASFDAQRFIDRALAQLQELEAHRRAAARIAFAEAYQIQYAK